ncbi:hypothetical protein NDU88_000621 [Pleurodeles waltl]|uniref:Secreted protein n=1 Tax=Pleurodeles waltl TaxID=8319 RepID=A0AAV7WJG5_PLEWA|nr:hypothetical protein NDU88_000621 [Pleurodeles waltl]
MIRWRGGAALLVSAGARGLVPVELGDAVPMEPITSGSEGALRPLDRASVTEVCCGPSGAPQRVSSVGVGARCAGRVSEVLHVEFSYSGRVRCADSTWGCRNATPPPG